MAEPLARGITGLVPMVHVADVQSTVDFYKLMGLEVRGSVRNSAGDLQWVYMACERAEVMFTRCGRAGNRQQAGRTVLSLLARSDSTP